MISIFWTRSIFKHVLFWCRFLDPHLTTYQSNIRVRIIVVFHLVASTLKLPSHPLQYRACEEGSEAVDSHGSRRVNTRPSRVVGKSITYLAASYPPTLKVFHGFQHRWCRILVFVCDHQKLTRNFHTLLRRTCGFITRSDNQPAEKLINPLPPYINTMP